MKKFLLADWHGVHPNKHKLMAYIVDDGEPLPLAEQYKKMIDRQNESDGEQRLMDDWESGNLLYNTTAAKDGILPFPFLIKGENGRISAITTAEGDRVDVALIRGEKVLPLTPPDGNCGTGQRNDLDIFSKFYDVSVIAPFKGKITFNKRIKTKKQKGLGRS